jgi:hypothetical protein
MALPEDDLFPPDYLRSPRLTPYQNLEGAKLYWLILRADEHASALAEDRRQLPGLNGENKAKVQAAIEAHTAAINEAKGEIKVLDGADAAAKRALVKANVERWIKNLRSRALDFRRYEQQERKAAADANNKQDSDRHEGNAQADRDEADRYDRMAGDFDHDLSEAGL